MSVKAKIPYPLNVAGDFYVEDGCCVSCSQPFDQAPGLFEYEGSHCYVCRQPATQEEEDSMTHAISVSELSCIRYAGTNPRVLKKLAELNETAQCDALLPPE